MQIKVFTVFHRAIDERLIFDLLTPDEVNSYFTLYAVNATRPDKLITKLDSTIQPADSKAAKVMLEYELPWHDPTIQSRGFMETSCYIHLLKNNIHDALDYIGVAQYDMRWTQKSVNLLRTLSAASSDDPKTAYGLSVGSIMNAAGRVHPFTFPRVCSWTYLLQSYNRFFHQHWDSNMLIDKPFTLWQTYLLPRRQFVDLASWLTSLCSELTPWANQAPYPTHWGHLAGWTERAESIFIAARLAEAQLVFEPLHLHHDPSIPQKLSVSKNHYGSPL